MTEAGATFSPCRRWRYLLWRRWDEAKPVANFLMLNPSTADEVKLDPTCARARDYAERWGYGALIVTNVFGWRATDPARMKAVEGSGRSGKRCRHREGGEGIGDRGLRLGESRCVSRALFTQVRALLTKSRIKLHVLRVNANGEPAHPLYLPGRLEPISWAAPSAAWAAPSAA